MHRSAALAALRERTSPPGIASRRLPQELTAQGKDLWTRFGSLTAPIMRVSQWKRTVDLKAPRLGLLRPGMPSQQARELLERRPGAAPELQPSLALGIGLDDQQRIGVVRCMVAGDRPPPIQVDGGLLVHPGQAELARVLGSPLWSARLSEHETALVYDRGEFRQRLVLVDDVLAGVELWQREMLSSCTEAHCP